MNYKPGDLAIWVKRDVIVEIISAAFDGEIYVAENGFRVALASGRGIWRCRMAGSPQPSWAFPASTRFHELPIQDQSLRPIRDKPEQDETLNWVPVPDIRKHSHG